MTANYGSLVGHTSTFSGITIEDTNLYSYTFTSVIPGAEDSDLGGVLWSYYYDGIGGDTGNYDPIKGFEFSSYSHPYEKVNFYSRVFDIDGVTLIRRVKVEASCSSINENEATMKVLVNGEQVGDEVKLTNTSTSHEFALATPRGGHIEIVLTNPTNNASSLFIKSMSVDAYYDEELSFALKMVDLIEPFKTCDLDKNGYAQYISGYKHNLDNPNEVLKSLKVLDFATSAEYVYNSFRRVYVGLVDKYQALNDYYGDDTSGLLNLNVDQNTLVLSLVISSVALVSLSSIIYLKLRKKNRA